MLNLKSSALALFLSAGTLLTSCNNSTQYKEWKQFNPDKSAKEYADYTLKEKASQEYGEYHQRYNAVTTFIPCGKSIIPITNYYPRDNTADENASDAYHLQCQEKAVALTDSVIAHSTLGSDSTKAKTYLSLYESISNGIYTNGYDMTFSNDNHGTHDVVTIVDGGDYAKNKANIMNITDAKTSQVPLLVSAYR